MDAVASGKEAKAAKQQGSKGSMMDTRLDGSLGNARREILGGPVCQRTEFRGRPICQGEHGRSA